MTQTVGELGELKVLERVLRHYRRDHTMVIGPGDDSAVLAFDGNVAVTTDTMIEGNDFRLDWHEPAELGWKLAATNLSDVAAMGACPTALTIALACPHDTPVTVLEGIAAGLQRACDELAPGCAIAGGDLAYAPQLVCAVTAMGEVRPGGAVTRAGARPGHVVAYAGELGLSRIGLRALFDVGTRAREQHTRAVRAHLAPVPPIEAALAAGLAGVSAMMDVSDGLMLDGARLGLASGVTLNFDTEQLAAAFGEQDGVRVPIRDLLASGEDHGFLATFPTFEHMPNGFRRIGTVVERAGDVLVDGEQAAVTGWDPFQPVQPA